MGGRTRRCAQTSMHKPLCTNPSHKPFAQTPAQNAQNAQTRTNPHKPAQTCAQKEFFSIKNSINDCPQHPPAGFFVIIG